MLIVSYLLVSNVFILPLVYFGWHGKLVFGHKKCYLFTSYLLLICMLLDVLIIVTISASRKSCCGV